MRTFVIEGKPLEEVTIKMRGQSLTLTEGVEVTVIVVVASQQPLALDPPSAPVCTCAARDVLHAVDCPCANTAGK